MEFGQFLTRMTLMPTSKSADLADKVVDRKTLHQYDWFPG